MWSLTDFDIKAVSPFMASITVMQWLLLASAALFVHTSIHYIYNAFFHPLSKYPGPRFASVSGIWEIYNLASGRWPWAVEAALEKYGDVVRIGPNSLVFLDPQAANDIHGPKRDLRKTFPKTPLVKGLGAGDDGLLWERDPETHRGVSKKMSPAFSSKSLRDKEPTMNMYIDLMMTKWKQLGCGEEGLDLTTWLNWLCMDVAAELSCGWEMNQLRDMKDDSFLVTFEAANTLVTILTAIKTYPILGPLVLLFAPWKVMRSLTKILGEMRSRVRERIKRRHQLKHSDYFEQLFPAHDEVASPKDFDDDDRRLGHLLTVSLQFIVGGYDPTSVAIYQMFYLLLQNPKALKILNQEIRGTFTSFDEIEAVKLRTLPWLNACLSETLRLSSSATHHSLPRLSPGGVVNGEYIPKGVMCRTSMFTYNRSDRFFHDPRSFRPERWLPQDHARYNAAFADDDHRAHIPFIVGPRQCPGREVARIMVRLVMAKAIWSFDMEQVSKRLEFDRDFHVYGMWEKPELRVRFLPVWV